jgi:hypothetical protein
VDVGVGALEVGDVLPVGVGRGGGDDEDGEPLIVGVADEDDGIEVAEVEPLGCAGELDGTLDELDGTPDELG